MRPIQNEISTFMFAFFMTMVASVVLTETITHYTTQDLAEWATMTIAIVAGACAGIVAVRIAWRTEIDASGYEDIARVRGHHPDLDAEIAKVGKAGRITVREHDALAAMKARIDFAGSKTKALSPASRS